MRIELVILAVVMIVAFIKFLQMVMPRDRKRTPMGSEIPDGCKLIYETENDIMYVEKRINHRRF